MNKRTKHNASQLSSGQKHWNDRFNPHSSLSLASQETSIGDIYTKKQPNSSRGYSSEKAKPWQNMLHTKSKFNASVTDRNSQILKGNKNNVEESYASQGQNDQVYCNTTATPVSNAQYHEGECNWEGVNGNAMTSRQCEEQYQDDQEDNENNVFIQINQFYRKNDNNNNSNSDSKKGQMQNMMMIPTTRKSQVMVLKKDIFRHTLSYLDGIAITERKLEQKDKSKIELEMRKKQIEQQQQIAQGQQIKEQSGIITESQTSGNTNNNEMLHGDSSNSNIHTSTQNNLAYRNTSMFKSNNFLPIDSSSIPQNNGVIITTTANAQQFDKQLFPSVVVSGIPSLNQYQSNSIRNSINNNNNPNSLTESTNSKINPIFGSTPGVSSMKKIALLSIPLGDTPMAQSQVVQTFQTMVHFDEEEEQGGNRLGSNVHVCDCSGNYDIKEMIESDSDNSNKMNQNNNNTNHGQSMQNKNNEDISKKSRSNKDLTVQADTSKSVKTAQNQQTSLANLLLSNNNNNNPGSLTFRGSLTSSMMKEQFRGNNKTTTLGIGQMQQPQLKKRSMRVSKSEAFRELPMLLQPSQIQQSQAMLTSDVSRTSEMKRLCLKEGQSFSNKQNGIDNNNNNSNTSQLSHRSSQSQQELKKKQVISKILQKEGDSLHEKPDWLKNILSFKSGMDNQNNNNKGNRTAPGNDGNQNTQQINSHRRLLQQCQKLNIPIDMDSIQALSASKLQIHHNSSQSLPTQQQINSNPTIKNQPECGGIRDYMRNHNYLDECARLKTFYRFGVNTQSKDENNQKLQNIVKQVIPSNEKGTLACNELWSDKHMKKIHDRANFAKEKQLIAEYIAYKERHPTGRDKMESPKKREHNFEVKEWNQINDDKKINGQVSYQQIMVSLQGKRKKINSEEIQTERQGDNKLNDGQQANHLMIDNHTISPAKRKQNLAESQAEQLIFREFLQYTDNLIHHNQDDMMDIKHQLKGIIDAKKYRK